MSKKLHTSSRYIKYVPGGNTNEPGVVNPDPHPVGDYYSYIYAQDIQPEFFAGLDKPYPNSYYQAPMYEWDNYMFEYSGQWFDHGNPFLNWFWILLPFFMYMVAKMENVSVFA